MASENFACQLSSSRSNLAVSEEVLGAVNIYTPARGSNSGQVIKYISLYKIKITKWMTKQILLPSADDETS